MPSGTITAGCLAGALSLVLALRSFRAHLAAQSLSHVAPMTVAALLAALKGESKSTVRSGDPPFSNSVGLFRVRRSFYSSTFPRASLPA